MLSTMAHYHHNTIYSYDAFYPQKNVKNLTTTSTEAQSYIKIYSRLYMSEKL